MIETPWYIDELTNAMLNSDTADPDFLSDAAAEYAEACAAANVRLREIAPLLRRELRSEVIQLAEMEPNVLELVAVLDFPELNDWCTLLKFWNREPPPPLLLDIASQINETYAIEAPLQSLLKRHRLLPLTGAPLSDRIHVLRELVKADPDTLVWQQDVQVLEESRVKEIRSDLEEAFKREDLPRVMELVEELISPDWSVSPMPRVVTMAKELKQRLLEQKTLVELEKITEELIGAQAEFDVGKGRQVRKQYNALLTRLRTAPSPELISRAQEPLDWLVRQDAMGEEAVVEETVNKVPELLTSNPQQASQVCQKALELLEKSTLLSAEVRQDFESRLQPMLEQAEVLIEKQNKYDAACQRLATALSGKAPPENLKPFYNAIFSFEGFEFPPDLMLKYKRYVGDFQAKATADKRYKRIVIFTIVGSIMAAVLFFGYQFRTRHIAITSAQKLEQLIEGGKLSEAEKYLKGLGAGTQQDKRVHEQTLKLEKLQKEERQRKKDFNEALKSIETDLAAADREVLQLLDKLARSSREKKQVAELKSRVLVAKEQQKAERKAELTTDLDHYQEELDNLRSLAVTPDDDLQKQLSKLSAKIEDIEVIERKDFPRIADRAKEMLDDVRELTKQVLGMQQKADLLRKESEQRDAITKSLGDPVSYRAALQMFVDSFPDSMIRTDYLAILKNELLWTNVDHMAKWKKFHRESSLEAPTPAELAAYKTRYETLAKTLGESPFDPYQLDREKFYTALGARNGGMLTKSLKEFLNNPLIGDLWMVQAKNGKRYYHDKELIKDDLREVGSQLVVPYRPNAQFGVDDDPDLIRLERDDIVSCGRAPHSYLAGRMMTKLKELDSENWEQTFLAMAIEIREDKNQDPVLKLKLLQNVLKTGGEGSYPLQQAFFEVSKELNGSRGDFLKVDWIKPSDAKAELSRLQASNQLKEFPDFAKLKEKAKLTWDRLKKPVDTSYDWLARLDQEGDGTWVCLWRDTVYPAKGELYTLQTSRDPKKFGFQKIGDIENDQVAWDRAFISRFVAGSPIYVHSSVAEDSD